MEDTLLQDLVMYRKSKDKGVMMASKGLLSLYRNVGAELLHKRDRGKNAALAMRSGDGSLPQFGQVYVDDGIAGIELLEEWKEEERKKKRTEAGLDSDEEDEDEENRIEKEEAEGWKNWDVEDDDSDGSGGWIDVESDGEDIVVSDSEDEKPKKKAKIDKQGTTPTADPGTPASIASTNITKKSTLATTRILTPADLLKLKELQQKSAIVSSLNNKKTHHNLAAASSVAATRNADDEVTAANIEGLAMLSHKDSKEEKIAKAKGDKGEKHVSNAAMRKEKKQAEGKSTTNKEKARQKNFFMTLGKAKKKGKRSLTDVKKIMKGHYDRAKRGGKRGNAGN
jgi:protein SDA1